MLKIRFQRAGKKHDAFYRIVVCEHTAPIKWKFLEKVWSFSARKKEWTLNFNKERISHWISVWAKPSDAAARLLFKEWMKECEKFIEKRVMKMSNAEKKKIEDKKVAEEAKKAEAEAKATEKESEEVAEEVKTEEVAEKVTEETEKTEETK